MEKKSVWNEYGEELERRVRLKTYPLAFKLLESEQDIPEGSVQPSRDLGHRLNLCQAFQLSRREGTSVIMLKEDMWCHEPVLAYGLTEPPQYWFEGHTRYPRDVSSLEAGAHFTEDFPRLKVGTYIGVASAPLKNATFDPDLVIIYCDSSQLSLLLLGREWKDGYDLKHSLSSHAACVYGVVPAILDKGYQVAIPCRGDHYGASAGDDEMIFSVHRDNLGDLITGLREVEKTGSKLPQGYKLHPQYPGADAYEEIARMMGLRE